MSPSQLLNVRPYIIQAATIEPRYARGWHCLGLAADFTEKPVAFSYFGTKLVVYRGADGQVHILDAYCPHMGADLSLGCVEGNSIRCPFHAWRWGADGVCDDIPYARRIPARAAIKSWPTLEQNKLLFVWNDPEGNAPPPETAPPRIDDCFSDAWSEWDMHTMHIPTNCRELVDNHADWAHFGPVHHATPSSYTSIVHNHVFTSRMIGSSTSLAEGEELFSEAIYYGPAYMVSYMTGRMAGIDVASRLLVAHVPIDANAFDLRFGVMIRKNPQLSEQQNAELIRGYSEASRIAFLEDVAIWRSKTRIDNPLLCDGDGPIHLLRQWYNQFYTDAAQVGARWREPKTIVVDVQGLRAVNKPQSGR